MLPTQASTFTSAGTYQQTYAGSSGLSLLNDTEIAAYESNIASESVQNTNITNAQVTVTNQKIVTLGNRRNLQDQSLIETLKITYDLKVVYYNIDEISALLRNHVPKMIERKNELKTLMINLGKKVDEVVETVEVISAPSVSFLASASISVNPSNSPSFSPKQTDFTILPSNTPSQISKAPSISLKPKSKKKKSKSKKSGKNKKKGKKKKKKEKKKKKKDKKKKSSNKTERPRRNPRPAFISS